MCRSVIDFEYTDAEIGKRISQRERVKACTQHYDLARAGRNAICHRILGKPAARGDEQAPWPEQFIGRQLIQGGGCLVIQDSRRERVFEDRSAF